MVCVHFFLVSLKANVQMVGNAVAKLSLNETLSKLPYAEGAGWDTDLGCLQGTREALIDDIYNWARNTGPTAELYLLTAVAGAGKSAIAHTIDQQCADSGILLTSFFFKRDVAGCDRPDKLLSTLVYCYGTASMYDLAQIDEEVSKYVASAVELDHSLPSAPLSRQFKELLMMSSRRMQTNRPLVIILDALDEGASEALLRILCDELNYLPGLFRIVVTSRPDERLVNLSIKEHVCSLEMDLEDTNNLADIEKYIKHQASILAKAKMTVLEDTWLSGQLLADVIQKAEGLFQWVSVVFSYLQTVRNPLKQLENFLSNPTLSGADLEMKMDLTYTEILKKCNWKDSDFVDGYQLIIGAVIALKRPLSKDALQQLHGDTLPMQITDLVAPLSSILPGIEDGQHSMLILHQSLCDFLILRTLDKPETCQFYLDEKEYSARLALMCLELVNRILPLNIVNLDYLSSDSITEEGIPDIAAELKSQLSEEALYACTHWIDHIRDVAIQSTRLTEAVETFISQKMVYWMEIAGLLELNASLKDIWTYINVSARSYEIFVEMSE